ncbi:MAG: hypothetical protein FRX48_04118 [Lasallia pustulata]|uniref:Uncharacterized protein n=1 Tax=Lasallia pustulata TaxID=136370 RepID=A0A1W5D7I3_9LECA|nr:MAG: hypothetical protein FRX48_04118 [Lasallia pustulata]SLM39005.1 hypothetical protein LPUS_01084 [Lasallia pustulata]
MALGLPSSIAGIVAVLATIASTTFIMIFAITLTAAHLPTRILALVAAVTQLLLLITLAYLTIRQVRGADAKGENKVRGRRWPPKENYTTMLILPSLAAALVAAATLGWIKIRLDTLPVLILGRSKMAFLLSAFTIWAVSLLAQTAFCVSIVRNTACPMQDDLTGYVTDGLDIEQQMEEPSRPNTAVTTHPQRYQEAPLISPSSSPTATEALSSLRSSLSVVVRPVTSRTRLISRQNSFPRASKSSSFDISLKDRTPQDDGFDTWDTSGVGSHIRETVLHSSPPTTRGPGLETIPGSRSPSPANALDGPYNLPSPRQSPTYFSRPVSRRQRSASASNEDHIHPLFRTSSPTPPPTATPGTTITATPLAGQLMDVHALRRMRSGSLPSSPSAGTYFDSINDDPVTRIPTPPGRDTTPPIPDFILTAGARASMMGYGRRKLSLRPSEADAELEQSGSGG